MRFVASRRSAASTQPPLTAVVEQGLENTTESCRRSRRETRSIFPRHLHVDFFVTRRSAASTRPPLTGSGIRWHLSGTHHGPPPSRRETPLYTLGKFFLLSQASRTAAMTGVELTASRKSRLRVWFWQVTVSDVGQESTGAIGGKTSDYTILGGT